MKKIKSLVVNKAQIIPLFLGLLLILVIAMFITVNIGKIAIYKTYAENAADAGSLSAGATMSRVFNLTVDWNKKYFMNKYDSFLADMETFIDGIQDLINNGKTDSAKNKIEAIITKLDGLQGHPCDIGKENGFINIANKDIKEVQDMIEKPVTPTTSSSTQTSSSNATITTYISSNTSTSSSTEVDPQPNPNAKYYLTEIDTLHNTKLKNFWEKVWLRLRETVKMVDRGRLEALREGYRFSFENSGILERNKGPKTASCEKNCYSSYDFSKTYQNYQREASLACASNPEIGDCFNKEQAKIDNNNKTMDDRLKNLNDCLAIAGCNSRRGSLMSKNIENTSLPEANLKSLENKTLQYDWFDEKSAATTNTNHSVYIGPIKIARVEYYYLWMFNLMKDNPSVSNPTSKTDEGYLSPWPNIDKPDATKNDLEEIYQQLVYFGKVIWDKLQKARDELETAERYADRSCCCRAKPRCRNCSELIALARRHKKLAIIWLKSAIGQRTNQEKYGYINDGELSSDPNTEKYIREKLKELGYIESDGKTITKKFQDLQTSKNATDWNGQKLWREFCFALFIHNAEEIFNVLNTGSKRGTYLPGETAHCIMHARHFLELYRSGIKRYHQEGANDNRRRLRLVPADQGTEYNKVQTEEVIYAISDLMQLSHNNAVVKHENLVDATNYQKHGYKQYGLWQGSFPEITRTAKVKFLGMEDNNQGTKGGLVCLKQQGYEIGNKTGCEPDDKFTPSLES